MSDPRKVEPRPSGVVMPLCHWCRHRDLLVPWVCRAYPEEIPQEIRWMNVDHRLPYVGDGGIRFELREDMDPLEYAFLLRDFFHGDMKVEKPGYEAQIAGILERRGIPLSTLDDALPKTPTY
jgi:hypothetical protein